MTRSGKRRGGVLTKDDRAERRARHNNDDEDFDSGERGDDDRDARRRVPIVVNEYLRRQLLHPNTEDVQQPRRRSPVKQHTQPRSAAGRRNRSREERMDDVNDDDYDEDVDENPRRDAPQRQRG